MSLAMDNFEFTAVAYGEDIFKLLLPMAFLQFPRARGWSIRDQRTFMLTWAEPDQNMGVVPFPVPVKAETAAPMILEWLWNTATWPKEPDIDGDCKKGFRITTANAPHVAICLIHPEWALQHK